MVRNPNLYKIHRLLDVLVFNIVFRSDADRGVVVQKYTKMRPTHSAGWRDPRRTSLQ